MCLVPRVLPNRLCRAAANPHSPTPPLPLSDSGDATIAAVTFSAGLGLTAVRRRAHFQLQAWAGGAVAVTGSVLRVVAFMHWTTDVLVGDIVGFTVGFGLPVFVFWIGHGALEGARGSDDDGADGDDDDALLLAPVRT